MQLKAAKISADGCHIMIAERPLASRERGT